MTEFIDYLTTYLNSIWRFLTFLLSIPGLLIEWINLLPPFLKTGIYTIIILITTILAIKIVTLIKEMIF